MKIGATIAALRKARGATQEQLAQAVGVSTPAVSKWETGATCPDIALLCPIARFLGATVDQLLSFQSELSEEEVRSLNQEMKDAFERAGFDAFAEKCEALLHQYPNSAPLKFCAAALYQRFAIFKYHTGDEMRAHLAGRMTELLEQVRREGDGNYKLAAEVSLAGIYMGEGKLDEAQALLDDLPSQEFNCDALCVALYRLRGEAAKARELIEKNLYQEIRNALLSLSSEATSAMNAGETARAGALIDAYEGVVQALRLEDQSRHNLRALACLKAGDLSGAQRHLHAYVDALMDMKMDYTGHPFFSTVPVKADEQSLALLKRTILRAWQVDDGDSPYRQIPGFEAEMARLQASLPED